MQSSEINIPAKNVNISSQRHKVKSLRYKYTTKKEWTTGVNYLKQSDSISYATPIYLKLCVNNVIRR